jgi:hypothetical protein
MKPSNLLKFLLTLGAGSLVLLSCNIPTDQSQNKLTDFSEIKSANSWTYSMHGAIDSINAYSKNTTVTIDSIETTFLTQKCWYTVTESGLSITGVPHIVDSLTPLLTEGRRDSLFFKAGDLNFREVPYYFSFLNSTEPAAYHGTVNGSNEVLVEKIDYSYYFRSVGIVLYKDSVSNRTWRTSHLTQVNGSPFSFTLP